MKVTLYVEGNFTGANRTLTAGDYGSLGSPLNDQVSSLIVEKVR